MSLQLQLKYGADRVLALILIILCAPLFVLIAILIWIEDRGPVFFRQDRLGLHAEKFLIHKFRTMVVDADALLAEDGSVVGNRITRIGRILRFVSLDELPQLLDIVAGHMSIVGPRPVLPEHYDRYTETQKGRFKMKPGITGLAQVSGRNTLRWSERIDYDLQYIRDYSLWLDIKILVRTVKVVLFREGVVLDRNPEHADDLGGKKQ